MSSDELSDIDIIRKIIEYVDDEKSEANLKYYSEILYKRYYNQAYNISRYFGLSRDDAEEAIQEAFIRLFKNIKKFNLKKEFKPWFFRIVINCSKDKFKELKKNRYVDIQLLKETLSKKDENFFEEFHFQEHLNSIISSLPNKLKSVIVLKIYSEMDFKMIAETLGISIRQVHNRINKAYKMMKSIMKNINEG